MSSFERFWECYPRSPRKGAKSACEKKWNTLHCEASIEQIIKHLTWMKTTDQWLTNFGAFIPAPLVYLNQKRWDGAEIPAVRQEIAYLDKLDEERKKAVPMPEHIKARLDALRGRV